MKIRNIKKALFRRKLEEKKFYDEVTSENSEFKKTISNWIYNIQKYRNIKIEKFKDLFTDLGEVFFPIDVKKCMGSTITFIDYQKVEYYLSICDRNSYNDCTKFIIGRRNSTIEPFMDREFNYEIFQEDNVLKKVLQRTSVLQLTEEGYNKDIGVDFYYDIKKGNTILTVFQVREKDNIVIKYPTQNRKFDDTFMKNLFENNKTNYFYYNVIPLLKEIIDLMRNEEISISIIATTNGEKTSEITIDDGIIERYSFTEIVSEEEMCIHQKIFIKPISEFLNNN